MKKNLHILLLLALLLTTCGKKAVDIDTNYVGHWRYCFYGSTGNCNDGCGTLHVISITEKSQGRYIESTTEEKLLNKGIARIKDDKLSIGSKEFIINQSPRELDSTECHFGWSNFNWSLVLDGDTFYKE